MLSAEWTIPASSAVLRLAQMKYQYFVSERGKQKAIFSGTSHQNWAYLDNISTNQWYIVSFQMGTPAAKWRMKISRYLRQYCRYWLHNFTVTLFQLYAKDDFNGSLQKMHGLVTLQNHCCKNQPLPRRILPECQGVWLTLRNLNELASQLKSLKLIKYFRPLEDCQIFCLFVIALNP